MEALSRLFLWRVRFGCYQSYFQSLLSLLPSCGPAQGPLHSASIHRGECILRPGWGGKARRDPRARQADSEASEPQPVSSAEARSKVQTTNHRTERRWASR